MTTLKECKKIQESMITYLSGDLLPEEVDINEGKETIDSHLKICPSCQKDFEMLQSIYRQTNQIEKKAKAVIKTIHWEENAEFITRNIQAKRFERAKIDSNIGLKWKIAVPALATIFILGIWVGYILFYNTPGNEHFQLDSSRSDPPVLTMLETTLTKKEMSNYFKQAQLFVTDLMRKCDESNNNDDYSEPIDLNTAKILLNKNRYFNENKTNPEFLSTRRLLKNIEFLLYEIMTLNSNGTCKNLQKIQKFIREQRILLKLRLVSKDVSPSEV